MDLNYDFESDGVSPTRLARWLDCRRKGLFGLMRVEPYRPNMAFVAGTIGHSVLEELYKDWSDPSAKIRTFKKEENWVRELTLEKCAEYYEENASQWNENEHEWFNDIMAKLIGVLPHYPAFWKAKSETKRMIVKEIEGEFKIPFETPRGLKTHLKGRFDLLLQDKKGGTWLYDHKFRARIEQSNIDTVPWDLQLNFYLYSIMQYTGKRPAGICHNIIRKPSIRKRKDENHAQYRERIETDVIKRPEHYFVRFKFATDIDMVARFMLDLEQMLLEFSEWIDDGCPTYSFGQPCSGKYGMCEFAPLCFDGRSELYHSEEHKGTETELRVHLEDIAHGKKVD